MPEIPGIRFLWMANASQPLSARVFPGSNGITQATYHVCYLSAGGFRVPRILPTFKAMTRKPGPPPDRKSPPLAPLTERIVAVLKRIPKGKVASYGQIAALAGSPRGARQVVRVLHTLSDREKLPWHRVVDRTGRISLPMEGHGFHQAALLRKEKVAVSQRGAIPMEIHGWIPKSGSRTASL